VGGLKSPCRGHDSACPDREIQAVKVLRSREIACRGYEVVVEAVRVLVEAVRGHVKAVTV
jgi:hypothetical protein